MNLPCPDMSCSSLSVVNVYHNIGCRSGKSNRKHESANPSHPDSATTLTFRVCSKSSIIFAPVKLFLVWAQIFLRPAKKGHLSNLLRRQISLRQPNFLHLPNFLCRLNFLRLPNLLRRLNLPRLPKMQSATKQI